MALMLWPLAACGFMVVVALPVGVCLFHYLTKIPCPLCGGTHALLFLAEGEPVQASVAYPLIIPLVALALGHTLVILAELVWAQRLLPQRWVTRIWLSALVMIIVVWVVRLAGGYY